MSDDKAMIEGTDEYKAAYEKAYDALENPKAVAVEEVKAIVEPVEQQIEVKAEVKAPEVTPAESPLETKVKELEERLSTTGKALKDTQTWGHKLAAELKGARKGLRDATAPELLKDLPGLEEAIRHVAVRDEDEEPVKPENE